MSPLILGIETSCDETAAAVVDGDGHVLSDVVESQIKSFAAFGGIVPEIAARDHVRALPSVVAHALEVAKVSLSDIAAVAVTSQPGLAGALLVGVSLAKGIAWAHEKPLVFVDHLVGHMLAIFLDRPDLPSPKPAFPFISLVASGGHTALYRVDGPSMDEIIELGATRDDAAGEAFDKAGKLLGLGYPGGPVIDKLASRGDGARFEALLPRPMLGKGSLEFSFSGLKTALARHVEANGIPRGADLDDLCAAYQRTVVEVLVKKSVLAAQRESVPRIVVGGGVAANSGLRSSFARAAAKHGVEVFIPALRNCTDNAAMIAYVGALRYREGRLARFSDGPLTKTALLRVTRKGGGKRHTAREEKG
jgi:N6-L-threonylcarbamoyladenine synthase